MAITLRDLRSGNKQIVFRLFVRRRVINPREYVPLTRSFTEASYNYESDWVRVDNLRNRQQVESYGSVNFHANTDTRVLNKYEINNFNIGMINKGGLFNPENDLRSFFNRHLGVRFTRVQVQAAYLQPDGTLEEDDLEVVFEGYIDKVTYSSDEVVKWNCAPYIRLFKEYDFRTLELEGSQPFNEVISSILNHRDIVNHDFFNIKRAAIDDLLIDNDYNFMINTDELRGDLFVVLTELLFLINYVPVFLRDEDDEESHDFNTLQFLERKSETLADEDLDIIGEEFFDISSYDPIGADRIRLTFAERGGQVVSADRDNVLSVKYQQTGTTNLNLDYIDDDIVRHDVLLGMLNYWGQERKYLSITLKRLSFNYFKILDRIYIRYRGTDTAENPLTGRYNRARYGVSVYANENLSVNFSSTFYITGIAHNLSDGYTKLTLEGV